MSTVSSLAERWISAPQIHLLVKLLCQHLCPHRPVDQLCLLLKRQAGAIPTFRSRSFFKSSPGWSFRPGWTRGSFRRPANMLKQSSNCLQHSHSFDNACRREVLPAVCKQWRELLAGPSQVWQNIRLRVDLQDEYHKVLQWISQHGLAALKLDAYFLRISWPRPDSENQPLSWPHYQHGGNMLPALMPNLQHLRLYCENGFMVAEQDLFSLQILTCLQTLHLDMASNGKWDMATLSPLQHLTALKELGMAVHGLRPGAMLLAPELSKLTLLTSLSLEQAYSGQGCEYDSVHAGNVISSLPRLRRLSLTGVLNRIPDAFSKLVNLRSLAVGGDTEAWPDFSVQSSVRSCKKLSSLRLHNFSAVADAGWLGTWSALSGLPSLSHLELDDIDLHAVGSDEWAFGSSLTSLRIDSGHMENFPAALLSLTTLRELCFFSANLEKLSEFPTGPYLEHITSLNLCEAKLPAFPGALSRASKLERISAYSDEPWLDVERLKSILPPRCVMDLLDVGSDAE